METERLNGITACLFAVYRISENLNFPVHKMESAMFVLQDCGVNERI